MDKRGSVTQVEIFGQTYSVRAEGDSGYIHDLARFVDSRMKEVAERTATVDTTKIAILAALNISDDLYQAEKRRQGDPTDAKARAERLIQKTGRRPGRLVGERRHPGPKMGPGTQEGQRVVAGAGMAPVRSVINPRRKGRFRLLV